MAKMNVETAIHVAFKEGMEEGLAENPGSHDIMKSSAAASPASETSCASTSTSPCPPDALRDSGEPDAR